jgi:hypothetical protein
MLNKIASALVGYGFLAAVTTWMAWMLYGCAEDVLAPAKGGRRKAEGGKE